MVQGKSKGLQQKAVSARNSTKTTPPKKGRRAVPPKKAAAVKHSNLQKSLSAKINKSIERQMISAASADKLTIMRHEGTQPSSSRSKGDKS